MSHQEQDNNKNKVNMGYLMSLLFTISIGTIQFGYSIGAWNSATDAYFVVHPAEDDDDKT